MLQYAGVTFLQSLVLVESDDTRMDREVWKLLRQADAKVRFTYYWNLMTRSYVTNPFLLSILIKLQP